MLLVSHPSTVLKNITSNFDLLSGQMRVMSNNSIKPWRYSNSIGFGRSFGRSRRSRITLSMSTAEELGRCWCPGVAYVIVIVFGSADTADAGVNGRRLGWSESSRLK